MHEMVGVRAVVGWTSDGHTAVDVNLYAFGPGRDAFIGHHDNTHVGQTLARLLGLDLAAMTTRLRQ
jgi:alkaline phosphatase